MTAAVLWLEAGAADVPDHDDWLSEGERTVLATLAVPKRRSDWRLGRWVAKGAVRAWCGARDAGPVEVRAADDGAPEAHRDGAPVPVSLSLSHSGGHACCAVTGAGVRVGCDIERIAPRSNAFVADFLTAVEARAVAGCPAAGRDLAVTLLWSAKESALKAVREGLRRDTRDVPVATDAFGRHAAPGTWHRLEVAAMAGWWRHDGDFVRTLVADPAPSVPLTPGTRR